MQVASIMSSSLSAHTRREDSINRATWQKIQLKAWHRESEFALFDKPRTKKGNLAVEVVPLCQLLSQAQCRIHATVPALLVWSLAACRKMRLPRYSFRSSEASSAPLAGKSCFHVDVGLRSPCREVKIQIQSAKFNIIQPQHGNPARLPDQPTF